jgi:hypothetical protein
VEQVGEEVAMVWGGEEGKDKQGGKNRKREKK